MDDKSYNLRVPKRWVRTAMIVGVTALIVAPLTAVAGHVFDDVPGSHTFHDNITWLADAGVTKGCNPPDNTEYCPDDNVTRGQMAAFMERFAGYIGARDGTPAQADNATTAGDADTLQGFGPGDLTPQVYEARNDGAVDLVEGTTNELASLTLPPGNYLIFARADLNNNAGDVTSVNAGDCELTAGSTSNTYEVPGLFGSNGPGDRHGLSAQVVHTFDATGQAALSCTPNGWFGNAVDPTITAISAPGGVAITEVAATSQGSSEE